MMFGIKQVNELIGVNESYQAPDALMKIVMNKPEREKLFHAFLDINTDVSRDWFREYFQAVQADRGEKKQDFTPQSLIDVMTAIIPAGNSYFEPAAGTGGITVTRWYQDCLKTPFWDYRPSQFIYQVEELSEAALPFLLFNLSIRGMNATVFNGDSLARSCRQVYFIQNDHDDALQFSSINVMPHNDMVTEEFQVSEWIGPEVEHIESTKLSGPVADVIEILQGRE